MLNEGELERKLTELEAVRAWSPRVVSKLEALIRNGDDWALFRVNPFTFAEERSVGEDEAIDLFLVATRVGLFQMTWNLLCPGCGDAVQSFATLRSVCSAFHCFLCCVDIETKLDDFVHVGFTISPRVRAIPAHEPSRLPVEDFYLRYRFAPEARVERNGARFVDILRQSNKGMRYIEAHTSEVFDIEIEAGAVAICDLITNVTVAYMVDAGAPGENAPLRVRLQDAYSEAPVGVLAPGRVRIEIVNDSDERCSAMLLFKPQAVLDASAQALAEGRSTEMQFDRFLSGRRLLTSQTFRQHFSSETIRGSEGIGVRDVSILFTDLKGSTAMYDRIGDLKAFALVNQHFDRLGRAVARHRGAVVKTIGDAVMASFETPADAVCAAREMLDEIDAFNQEVGEREIVLKVGIHRGASIAVTLNDRLDFFGQTVNVAARVQGIADADEIYLTEEVYRAPGVAALVDSLSVAPREVSLRGVQKPIQVFRVAKGEASPTSR